MIYKCDAPNSKFCIHSPGSCEKGHGQPRLKTACSENFTLNGSSVLDLQGIFSWGNVNNYKILHMEKYIFENIWTVQVRVKDDILTQITLEINEHHHPVVTHILPIFVP